MRAILLAFALGVLLLRALPVLPSMPLLAALAVVACISLGTRLAVVGAFGLGLAWAALHAQWALQDRLDPGLEQRVLWIEGRVSGLPAVDADSVGFLLADPSSRRGLKLPARIRLNWYGGPRPLAGERWRLAVELRSPAGLANPLGQDREAWLLAQGIGATGSVKDGQRLAAASGLATWRPGAIASGNTCIPAIRPGRAVCSPLWWSATPPASPTTSGNCSRTPAPCI
nr:ComEC/Rec2 family competence protein [Pseudomonas sp. EpS/L25]